MPDDIPTQEETVLAHSQTQAPAPPARALEQLFQEHHSRVFGAAYRVTGSAQDAEDVLQTVFLRLLRRGDQLDLSPGPASYLHRAAVNASLDLMRARGRNPAVPLDEAGDPEDGPGMRPDRRQEDREIRRCLREALLALSPKGAEIFTLRYLEGMKNQEIAHLLQMSQTSVAVTLHRARLQLKKEFRTLLARPETRSARGDLS